MTECCTKPPSIGRWEIYVRNPIHYPSRIIFDWNDGTGEKTIEGDNYLIIEENNYDPNILYVLTVKVTNYFAAACGTSNFSDLYTEIYSYGANYELFFSSIIGGRPYLEFQVLYAKVSLSPNSVQITNAIPGYMYFYIRWSCWDGSTSGSSIYSYNLPEIINIRPYANQPIQKKYRLKILKNGSVVFEEQKTTRPTVTVIPEQCLQAEQREYVRDYQNWKSKDYCQQVIQGNQTTLLLMSEQRNGSFLPLALAYEKSDERCALAPVFEVDCISCKTCPSNTCEVICGDMVCCYNSEGIAIDSFPLGELC